MGNLLANFRAAPNAAGACEFISRFDPARVIWTVGGDVSGQWVWASFYGEARREEAEAWIAARYADGRECWLLLGDTRTAYPADIYGARFAAAWSTTPEAFLTVPWPPLTIWLDRAGKSFAAWKLPSVSGYPHRDAGALAALCCTGRLSAMPQLDFIPLPGDMKPVGRMMGSIVRMPNHGRAAPLPVAATLLTATRSGGAIIDVECSSVGALPDYSGHGDARADLLMRVLTGHKIKGKILEAQPGPVVTVYLFEPELGVKASKIIGLADDLAMALAVDGVRVAVVPGRNAVGIEIPNASRETVQFSELQNSAEYRNSTATLPIIIGKTIGGAPVIADLVRLTHLLIAGTTGAGKSVTMNAMILSLLHRLTPAQCRFIMIDPKMLELTPYEGIPHLLTPVVTDPKRAVTALKWAADEMDLRYERMLTSGVRSLAAYNSKQNVAGADTLPYIVIVIDEFADLVLMAGNGLEIQVQRLSQKARAAGLHIIMCTQQPTTTVVTSVIKATLPSRIALQVTSSINSRVILGEDGAEQLLGQGDMLFSPSGATPRRVHGPFVSDDEVERFVSDLRRLGEPVYAADLEKAEAGMVLDGEDGENAEEGNRIGDLSANTDGDKAKSIDAIKGLMIMALVRGDLPTKQLQDVVKAGGYSSNKTFEKARSELKAAGVITSRDNDMGGKGFIWSLTR